MDDIKDQRKPHARSSLVSPYLLWPCISQSIMGENKAYPLRLQVFQVTAVFGSCRQMNYNSTEKLPTIQKTFTALKRPRRRSETDCQSALRSGSPRQRLGACSRITLPLKRTLCQRRDFWGLEKKIIICSLWLKVWSPQEGLASWYRDGTLWTNFEFLCEDASDKTVSTIK